MIINTNLSAQAASLRLGQTSSLLAKSLERLSSGSKITTPADDSAGLAESSQLYSRQRRTDAAASNLANAISFTQTQDAYMAKVNEALTRMNELSMMALDVTKTDSDRLLYDQEFKDLGQEVFAIGQKTFNGVSLFNGASFAVTNDSEGGTSTMPGVAMNRNNLAYFYGANDYISVYSECFTAQRNVQTALRQLATDRATVGANLEQLNAYHDQMATLKNNLSAANSRITDVDVAQESTNFARYNILVQSGTAMLAQANSLPQSVLKLLGLFLLLVTKGFISI